MAGHPTIGTTFALARSGVIDRTRDAMVFGLGVGPTPVSLTWKGDDLSFAWMTQSLPVFGDPVADAALAAAAVSLPAPALVSGRPVQAISCGVAFVFIPLTTRHAVDEAAPNAEAIAALLRASRTGAHGVFLFSAEPGSDGATVYSRMFAPELGVVEDPATGSASGPLGCYLVQYRIVAADKADAMLSLQGVKMGRPSHVHISIGISGGGISSVRVGGEAVLAGEGTLYL
jgi:trans-2,3-dihydro-3-hydroxyanthranilate isomerase